MNNNRKSMNNNNKRTIKRSRCPMIYNKRSSSKKQMITRERIKKMKIYRK
jgi:hypothetical protein